MLREAKVEAAGEGGHRIDSRRRDEASEDDQPERKGRVPQTPDEAQRARQRGGRGDHKQRPCLVAKLKDRIHALRVWIPGEVIADEDEFDAQGYHQADRRKP